MLIDHLVLNGDLPGGSNGKEPTCNAGDLGLMPWSGRFPGEGNDNSLQTTHFYLGKPKKTWARTSILTWKAHGQKSLEVYRSWGCRVRHN